MTNKNKKFITNAMTHPNAGVLRVLLEYVDNIEKLAHIEGFEAGLDRGWNVGYPKGYKDGYKKGRKDGQVKAWSVVKTIMETGRQPE